MLKLCSKYEIYPIGFQGWDDVQSSNIGIKWMGRIDRKAFMKTCSERFPPGRAEINAHKLLCKWQEIIESSECCPFRVIGDEKGNLQVPLYALLLILLLTYCSSILSIHIISLQIVKEP